MLVAAWTGPRICTWVENEGEPHRKLVAERVKAFEKDRSRPMVTGPVMAADDFAEFGKVARGLFFSFGTQKPGTIYGVNHAKHFVADDPSNPVGMRGMTYVLVNYLQNASAHQVRPGNTIECTGTCVTLWT